MGMEIITANNTELKALPSWEELLERFSDYIESPSHSVRTVETYLRAVKQFIMFMNLNGIKNPTREDVKAFREELRASGHKPTTIQNYITAVKKFFGWTYQEGFYPNIAENLKGARLDREHKKEYLTSRQVKEVLDTIDRSTEEGLRNYAILVLMVTCGLRTIEVSRADIGDIRNNADNRVLYVQGKGKEEKAEFVKLSDATEKAIREYLKVRGETRSEAPLFASTSNNNRGERMTTRSISGIVKTSLRQVGLYESVYTAHSLRHTAVTLSLLAGRDLAEVQQFARHANIATTMIYNHAIDKAKNGCSEAITKAIFG